MTQALRIRDWSEHYETYESKKRKGSLDWVAVPTSHDGKRYRRIARHAHAAEVYAGWCLILSVGAKCPMRGLLVDEHGEPLSAEDLSDQTGFPVDMFTAAIDVLTDPKIAWLEKIQTDNLPISAAAPADANIPQQSNGTPAVFSVPPDPTSPDPTPPHKTLQEPNPNTTPQNATPANGLVGNISLGGGVGGLVDTEGPMAPAMKRLMRTINAPTPAPGSEVFSAGATSGGEVSNETLRKMEAEHALTQCGVTGETKRGLYMTPHVTAQLVRSTWAKVKADAKVDDPVAVLIHRLRKH